MYYYAKDTLHLKYKPHYCHYFYMISLGSSCFVPLYHHHIGFGATERKLSVVGEILQIGKQFDTQPTFKVHVMLIQGGERSRSH